MIFITYEAFLFAGILKKIPYGHLIKAMGLPQKSISIKAQDEFKEHYHRQYIMVPIAALAATCYLLYSETNLYSFFLLSKLKAD